VKRRKDFTMQDWQERIEEQQELIKERLKKVEDQQKEPAPTPVPVNITVEHIHPDRDLLVKMQGDIDGLKADYLTQRESLADVKDRVTHIEATMSTLATKEDIARIEANMAAMESRLHGEMSALATRIIEVVKKALE
jgi:hypothetical protein